MSESIEFIRGSLLDESVGGYSGEMEAFFVDEIEDRGDGLVVYVTGDANPKSPPRKLNQEMLEFGYGYVDWVMNGTPDDTRKMFIYEKV